MNIQETLKKIKALFEDQPMPVEPAAAPVEPVAPVEMKEYTLADGTTVMIDKLEIGGAVTVNDLPATEGEYYMADGSSIKVDAAGLITEIQAAEPAQPELQTPEQMQLALSAFAEGVTNPDMQKMATILKAVFENVFGWQLREAQEKAQRDTAIALYQSGFEEQKKLKQGFAQLVALVEALAAEPAAEPLEQSKDKFSAQREAKAEKFKQLQEVLKKHKQ